MTLLSEPPDRSESAEYHFTYIDQVRLAPGEDIVARLAAQLDELLALAGGVSEERSRHRYAPDKWTLRGVLSHVSDTERVFAFRAFWFARGFTAPLPGFDQEPAAATAGADARPWATHVEEFRAVRESTLSLFRHLPAEAWMRRGTASGAEFSVRAMAFIIAGHAEHHRRIIEARYL